MKRSIVILVLASALPVSGILAKVAKAAPMESFVEAPGPKGPLKGTLLSPGSKSPVVLLIPGSGNVDRDGDAGPMLKAASLKLLATALAADGVASVRIDKRGVYASAAAGDANRASIEDMGQDVHAWASVLTAQLSVPCVWVAGHSEGGAVAIAAAQDPRQICGLVLLSTPGRALAEVVREQVHRSAPEPLITANDAILKRLLKGEHVPVADIPRPLMPLYAPPVQDKLIADFRFDPAAELITYRGPVMIVQGGTDLQVTPEDAALLKAASPQAKLLFVAGMNHVLKIASADRAANLATYADPSLPLAPGVASAVAAFVKTAGRR